MRCGLGLLAGAATFVAVDTTLDKNISGKSGLDGRAVAASGARGGIGLALLAAVTLDGVPENLALGVSRVDGGAIHSSDVSWVVEKCSARKSLNKRAARRLRRRCPRAGTLDPVDHADGRKAGDVALSGVSETALLTLNGRAYQARHPNAIIDDPMAIRLVDAIDFDFDKFGRKGQEMALRSLAFDCAATRYLSEHPLATVVALAEGLQTSFWRLNAALPRAEFRWLTIDFQPIIDLRERLLYPSPRITTLAQSALDYSWMDKVDTANGVFITAEGLLMYLQPDEAMGLISECASRFPGGQMVFDLPPILVKKLAPKGMRSSRRYRVPPMPFSLSAAQLADLVHTVRGIRAVQDLPMPRGRGWFFGKVFPVLWQFKPTRNFRGAYTLLEFG